LIEPVEGDHRLGLPSCTCDTGYAEDENKICQETIQKETVNNDIIVEGEDLEEEETITNKRCPKECDFCDDIGKCITCRKDEFVKNDKC